MSGNQASAVLGLASRLKRLLDVLSRDTREICRARGLDFEPRWFAVFDCLYRQGPKGVTVIARELGISHPAVNQVAAELAAAGLIATYRDRADKRKRVLALTAKGRAMMPALEPLWADLGDAIEEVTLAGGDDFLLALTRLENALASRPLPERIADRDARDGGALSGG